MHILTYPSFEKQLRAPGQLVTREQIETTEFKEKLERLKELANEDGVGLAATQADWQVNLFLLQVDRSLKRLEKPQVIVNPIIMTQSKKLVKAREGCLSFPDLRLQINRPESLKWVWEDLDGIKYESSEIFEEGTEPGYFIRIVQHEVEHLSGKLFIDTLSPAQNIVFKKWLKLRITQQ